MPHYYNLGITPHKRHTQFRKLDGTLFSEELFSTEGFSNDYSLLYHFHPPTRVIKIGQRLNIAPEISEEPILSHRSFEGFNIKPRKDFVKSRMPVLVNSDVHMVLAAPQESMTEYFYKNADADELIFVHQGSGRIITPYGKVPFINGDYVVIPRGTIYQIKFAPGKNRLFIVESFSPIHFPKRYLSKHGQLLEHAPFSERDIRPPMNLVAYDKRGDFLIKTKKKGILYDIHYAHHPFDVVGWDGYCYPFVF